MNANKRTIAIVDDEREVCDLLRILFDARGYRTLLAHDGDSGLALVLAERPDIVLMDIKMPGVNGFELLKTLRKLPETERLPVVLISAVTAGSGLSDEEWQRSTGADAYLTKPFEPNALLAIVERLLAAPR